jgi:hypothetical protein
MAVHGRKTMKDVRWQIWQEDFKKAQDLSQKLQALDTEPCSEFGKACCIFIFSTSVEHNSARFMSDSFGDLHGSPILVDKMNMS